MGAGDTSDPRWHDTPTTTMQDETRRLWASNRQLREQLRQHEHSLMSITISLGETNKLLADHITQCRDKQHKMP